MKHLSLVSLLLVGACGLAGCAKDEDPANPLVGTWQLTNRECYCAQTPLPNETVTFTTTAFSISRNGQLVDSGTYAAAEVTSVCGPPKIRALRFTYSSGDSKHFISTADGTTLVLDSGINKKCLADAGIVDTYRRQ